MQNTHSFARTFLDVWTWATGLFVILEFLGGFVFHFWDFWVALGANAFPTIQFQIDVLTHFVQSYVFVVSLLVFAFLDFFLGALMVHLGSYLASIWGVLDY